jgi:hypothetical protein
LDNILASHPLIGGLPIEGAFLTTELSLPEDFGWPRMWCRCLKKVRNLPENLLHKKAVNIKRDWSIWYAKTEPNLLEKSIVNSTSMLFFEKYFKPAHFIHIVRNGYAVAEGIRRKADLHRWKNKYYKHQYPIELCAEQWKQSINLINSDKKFIRRLIEIRYEDLVGNTAGVVNQILSFLGLPELSDECFKRNWNIHNIDSPITNMNTVSFKGLSANDILIIEKIARKELLYYGYEKPERN